MMIFYKCASRETTYAFARDAATLGADMKFGTEG